MLVYISNRCVFVYTYYVPKKTEPQYVCTRVSLNQKQTSYRLVVAESYIMNIVFWYAVNRVFYGFDAIRFCSSMSICNYIVFFVAIKNIFVLIKIVYCYRFYSISVQIYYACRALLLLFYRQFRLCITKAQGKAHTPKVARIPRLPPGGSCQRS